MMRFAAWVWRWLGDDLRWRIQGLTHATFLVGVSGVVRNDAGEILLLKHRFWRITAWALPSGYINQRETLEDALRREIREETGLEVMPARLLRLASGYRYRVEATYLCHVTGGALRPDSREIVEACFFPRAALPADLHPMLRAWLALADDAEPAASL